MSLRAVAAGAAAAAAAEEGGRPAELEAQKLTAHASLSGGSPLILPHLTEGVLITHPCVCCLGTLCGPNAITQ